MATINNSDGLQALADNETGLFVWIGTGMDAETFCPGVCLNILIDQLRTEGLHEQADGITLSAAEQLVNALDTSQTERFLKPFAKIN